jgi:hypothetical protein
MRWVWARLQETCTDEKEGVSCQGSVASPSLTPENGQLKTDN